MPEDLLLTWSSSDLKRFLGDLKDVEHDIGQHQGNFSIGMLKSEDVQAQLNERNDCKRTSTFYKPFNL